MNNLHEIIDNVPGHVRPGNQVDVDSFLSARNMEIQALLNEIRKFESDYYCRCLDTKNHFYPRLFRLCFNFMKFLCIKDNYL